MLVSHEESEQYERELVTSYFIQLDVYMGKSWNWNSVISQAHSTDPGITGSLTAPSGKKSSLLVRGPCRSSLQKMTVSSKYNVLTCLPWKGLPPETGFQRSKSLWFDLPSYLQAEFDIWIIKHIIYGWKWSAVLVCFIFFSGIWPKM